MFVRRTCILFVVVFLGGIVYASETTGKLQESDSIGMMPEVVVTAPRYENQDEAWAGFVEGVVVEAQRLPTGTDVTVVGMTSGDTSPNNGFDPIHNKNIAHLLLPLTLALATVSIVYMSVQAYLIAEEVEHERTKN